MRFKITRSSVPDKSRNAKSHTPPPCEKAAIAGYYAHGEHKGQPFYDIEFSTLEELVRFVDELGKDESIMGLIIRPDKSLEIYDEVEYYE